MIKTKYNNDLLTKRLTDIIDEVEKPKSLNELKAKYGLPLTVLCVKEFYSSKSGEAAGLKGKVLNYTGKTAENGYWISKERYNRQSPDSKKFIISKK